MEHVTLQHRRERTHAIVEGALLGDIAIVFLMMRVYLPIPVVRTLLRTLAAVPVVMLMQRRGLQITVLATLASYVLFSALVGPILALTAIDVAVAGILVGLGRTVKLGPAINALWSGPAYAVLDLILPTIASLIIFRYPVKDLIHSARNFINLFFHATTYLLQQLHAPASAIQQLHSWQAPAADHWVEVWIAIMILYGLLNQYLVAVVAETVLKQIPQHTLARQKAA